MDVFQRRGKEKLRYLDGVVYQNPYVSGTLLYLFSQRARSYTQAGHEKRRKVSPLESFSHSNSNVPMDLRSQEELIAVERRKNRTLGVKVTLPETHAMERSRAIKNKTKYVQAARSKISSSSTVEICGLDTPRYPVNFDFAWEPRTYLLLDIMINSSTHGIGNSPTIRNSRFHTLHECSHGQSQPAQSPTSTLSV